MKSYTLKVLCAAVIAASMTVPASAQPVSPISSPTQLVSYAADSEDSSVAVTVTDGVMGYTAEDTENEESESVPERRKAAPMKTPPYHGPAITHSRSNMMSRTATPLLSSLSAFRSM